MQEIPLPNPRASGPMSVEEAIARRRSVRQYAPRVLTMEQIGQLAWAAQGVTDREWGFRAAPSAGALYPLELYVVTPEGTYHYVPSRHALQQTSRQDQRAALARAALGQSAVRDAPASFVIVAVVQRAAVKYGERAGRYVALEAGHVAQNIHLQAVALGLDSLAVGAFFDDQVAKVLDLPPDQDPIYIVSVGYRE